ncbi:MAG: helix-turn-helix domain-containing protein [Haliscomenobacter sp.]|nr:helix-turn-helix domain-containing protein [Haliscomenobacter sp.]
MVKTLFQTARITSGKGRAKLEAEYAFEEEFFHLIWFHLAGGVIVLDFDAIPVDGNQLVCPAPGTRFQWKAEKGTEGWVIAFHASLLPLIGLEAGTVFEAELLRRRERPLVPTDAEFTAKSVGVFEALERIQESNHPIAPEFLAGYLRILLSQTLRLWGKWSAPHSGQDAVWFRFNQLLDVHFRHQRRATFYAREIGLSLGYLNEVLKKACGKPAKALILERLFLEARRKASQRGISLQEAAYDLGFHSPGHFSRFFKQHSGSTFLEFRKKTQNR